jgi:MRG-binding protein
MPPKKKKNSVRAASTPIGDDDPMVLDAPENVEPPKPSYDPLKDPWTDEQETSLFKGIVKWKPAGMLWHHRDIQ